MKPVSRHSLVLGIFPNTGGFGFALFEGPLAPVDWGVIRIRGKETNRRCIQRIAQLVGQYSLDVLVLQDMAAVGTYRTQRIRNLNDAISVLAETQSVPVVKYSRGRVRKCFEASGAISRYAMAEAIGKHIPMLKRFVPPVRKRWMNENPKIGLFEAAALVLAFYQSTSGRR